MTQTSIDPTQVKGWGVDADPENDPTYPMKKRTNAEHAGYSWPRPTQQQGDVEVLHSNERPNLSAAFGTSTPPRGLSGLLRRFAFRYSESSYLHWLPLMLADRISMGEGILEDLGRGKIPNIPKELGWAAEWRHNRKSLVCRVLVGVALTLGIITYLRMQGEEDD
jgi:hypothetical protein